MKRWTNKLETLWQQAQLVGARRDRKAGNRRPAPPAPPSHVPEPQGEEQPSAAGPRTAPATAPRLRRPSRKQVQTPQEQDVLGTLLQTDVRSQQLAEKLWWKWRHVYLRAKQRELARRRGTPAEDEAGQAT